MIYPSDPANFDITIAVPKKKLASTPNLKIGDIIFIDADSELNRKVGLLLGIIVDFDESNDTVTLAISGKQVNRAVIKRKKLSEITTEDLPF